VIREKTIFLDTLAVFFCILTPQLGGREEARKDST